MLERPTRDDHEDGRLMPLDVEALYTRYGPMVLRRCARLLGDEDAAVDATQEVFVRALERADQLHDHAPSSLLYTMATRVCLNRLRSARRRPEHPDSALIEALAALSGAEERMHARALLGRAPEVLVHGGGGGPVLERVEGAQAAPVLVLEGLARWLGMERPR